MNNHPGTLFTPAEGTAHNTLSISNTLGSTIYYDSLRLSNVTLYTKLAVLFLSLIGGGLLALAFAPFKLWPFAILSPACLLWVWQHPHCARPRHAFYLGSMFGLGLYGLGVSWVFVSIHQYGNTDAPLAVFITGLLIVGFALLLGLQGYIFKRFFKQPSAAASLLGFPCLWVSFEWIKSVIFTGFPWLFLGNTQLDTPLAGYAPIGSVYAVSIAVAISSGALVAFLSHKRPIKILAMILLIAIWMVGYGLHQQEWTKLSEHEYTASLVQGNIAPLDKFAARDPIQAARNIYGQLSHDHWGNTLVIWPENAITYPLPFVEPFLNELNHTAATHHSTLITGLQTVVNEHEYYNSMIAVGKGNGLYHKRHLLPFGEFLPFEHTLRGLINFFNIPMSSFIKGPPHPNLLTAAEGKLKIAPLICYEIAFPELVRESIENAHIMVTLTEDGWFGNSWGPHQHLEIAQMRALETGRPILRAATCGISAYIDSKGKIIKTAPQFQPLVLTTSFQGTTGITPWVHMGIWPILAFLILGLLVATRLSKRSR